MAGSILGFSLPTFWVGLMLIMVFSVMLGWLPSTGRGPTRDAASASPVELSSPGTACGTSLLPAINLALFKLSLLIRLTRAGTREALLQDYVKFARAKGLSDARVVGVHVLKNILIPIVTVIGLEFGSLIAFAIVTETIFAWPGMGKLLIDSINVLDRPVIVAYLLVIVMLFIADQPRGRRALLGARPARAHRSQGGMSVVGTDACRDRAQPPTAAASRRRCAAVARLRREPRRRRRARAARADRARSRCFAPLISPQNPYDLAQLDVMDSRLAAGRQGAMAGYTYLARHRRPGPRHAVGDLLRPAHLARRGRGVARSSRSRIGLRVGPRSPPTSAAGSRTLIMRSSTSSSRSRRS